MVVWETLCYNCVFLFLLEGCVKIFGGGVVTDNQSITTFAKCYKIKKVGIFIFSLIFGNYKFYIVGDCS